MAQIQGLEFLITSDIGEATRNIDTLSTSLTGLKNAAKGGVGLTTIATQLQRFDTALKNIDLEKFSTFANALGRFAYANPKLSKSFVSNLSGLGAALSSITSEDVSKLEQIGTALSKFPTQLSLTGLGSLGKTVQNNPTVEQTFTEAPSVMSRTESMFGSLSSAVAKFGETITPVLGRFGMLILSFTRFAVGGIAQRIGSAFRSIGNKITGLFNSIKRIAFYRLIRSLMRMLTQGFQEGLKNMYAYSQTVGTQFAGSMDRLATSALYLKNSLASIAAPLINALAPAIDFIADKLVNLFNLIAQFIARLTGRDTYTAAKKVATTWQGAAENATGGAKKAVDEFRRYVLSFDELNILGSESNSGGSGGSGGAGGLSGADMFEERTIDEGVSSFADRIRKAFEEQDWIGLGQVLGDGFNRLIDRIPWDAAGEKFGTAVNAVFTTADSFFVEADFVALGESVAEFLNSAMEQTDFSHIGGTISGAITSAVDTVGGLLGGLNWASVGQAVTDTLSGFFERNTDWMNSHDWDGVGKDIVNSAEEFFRGGDWNRLSSSLSETIGTAIRSVAQTIGGVVNQLFVGWYTKILKFVETHDSPLDIFTDWFLGGLRNAADWLNENIFSPFGRGLSGNPNFNFVEWVDSLFGPSDFWQDAKINRAAGIHTVGVGSDEYIAKITGEVSLKREGWTTLDNYVGELSAKPFELGRSGWTTLDRYVGTISTRNFALGKNNWTTLDKYVGEISTKKFGLGKNGWSSLDSYVGNISSKPVSLYKSGWSSLDGYVGTISAKPLSLYKSGWNSIYDFTGTKVDVGVQLYKSGWSDFKSFIGLSGGGIVTRNGAVKFFRKGGWMQGARSGMFPQYAGGTPNAGSAFIAGEAGPELVGHINNRSEVLNESQLAHVMYESTRDAIYSLASLIGGQTAAATNDRPVQVDLYLDSDRIATAVTKGQQAQNRRYSPTRM